MAQMPPLLNETELLYHASSQLTRASTPLELLEAVSDYPRTSSASRGILFYFEFDNEYRTDVVAAEWIIGTAIPYETGSRFRLPHGEQWMSPPQGPILVQDTGTDMRLSSITRDLDLRHQVHASVILPLYNKGRWIGAMLFGWDYPCAFNERDERIYTVLQQLAAPVVDSTRLIEQMQKRARELETIQNEMAVVYDTSRQLVAAASPAELLSVISPYAHLRNAVSGHLLYFDHYQPNWIEVVAHWGAKDSNRLPIGWRIDVGHRTLGQHWLSHPERPTLIPDIMTSEIVGDDSRMILNHYGVRAFAALPLNHKGQWIGVIYFFWQVPVDFDNRDERIFTAIQQHTAPVIDAIRLTEQTQRRAADLEVAKHEIDILYGISHQLVKATNPSEILDAVSTYAREQGALNGRLAYFVDFQQQMLEIVAAWSLGDGVPTPVGTLIDITSQSLPHYSMSRPDRPTFVKDMVYSELLDPAQQKRAKAFNVRGAVRLPMYVNGRWIGILAFDWNEPIVFDERDERIFTALQRQVAPVIDSIRLLDQSRGRTIELEQANQELNLLYRTGEIINSANTYQEVVEAVAQFDPDAEVVTLMLWESMDWETANELEVHVVIDRVGDAVLQVGARLPKENFPIAKLMMGQRVWLFDDAHTDPRVDPITAENWALLKIRSFSGSAMYIDQHWTGGITFHSAKPRTFTERDRRLLSGVGDLVIAAIQRISAKQETEAAREEIAALYRVGEAINAANTYAELVNALSGIIRVATSVALYRWEGWDFETATYAEAIAATGNMQQIVGLQTPKAVLAYTERTQADRIIVVEDTVSESRYDDSTKGTFLERKLLATLSIRLFVNQRWIGALVFQSDTPRVFSERDQRLAAGVGDYVLGAVERIRLREETDAARLRAEAFAERAHQLAVLEERNRLARELHDSVSQALYGIVLGAQTARTFLDRDPQKSVEPLDYVLSLSEAGLAEMRALIFELRPETLEKEGLVEALSKQVTMLQARHGLAVKTAFGPEPDIPIQLKEAVYWIAREALHNIVKHANASVVEIGIAGSNESLVLSIADNGSGFDIDGDYAGHLGLKSMSERAVKLGGTLHIHSKPGAGTNIQLHLPLAVTA